MLTYITKNLLLFHHMKVLRNTTWCYFAGVQFPISEKLSMEDVYDRRTSKPRSDILKEHFTKEGRIQEEVIISYVQAFESFVIRTANLDF